MVLLRRSAHIPQNSGETPPRALSLKKVSVFLFLVLALRKLILNTS